MNENMTQPDSQMEMGKKSNMLAIFGIVAVVAIVAFVVMQFSFNNTAPVDEEEVDGTSEEVMMDDESMQQDVTIIQEQQEDEDEQTEEGVVEIEMEAGDFSFTPDTITVSQGDTVRITMTSTDMMHDFVIDELDVESDIIPAGESTVIEFVADEAGEYEFYCSVGNHRQMGMVGTLIVE